MEYQLDVSDDGFLSLMADDGETKDDVRVPDGEIGEKINKLFTEEEKDTSEFHHRYFDNKTGYILISNSYQTSLFLRLWASKQLSKPRRLPVVRFLHFNAPDFDLVSFMALPFLSAGLVCTEDTRVC